MDITGKNLPRWMQGDWAAQAPLRQSRPQAPQSPAKPAPVTPPVSAKPIPRANLSPRDAQPSLTELVDALDKPEPTLAELVDELPELDLTSEADCEPAHSRLPEVEKPEETVRIVYRRTGTAAPSQRRVVPWLTALVLAFVATVVLATQGLAIPERGLTVQLPDAEPAPSYVPVSRMANDQAADPTMLTPDEMVALNPAEAEAVREAVQAELAGHEGYQGPRPGGIPFRAIGAVDRENALMCLTQAIYYEAANEPDDGQRAVAQVILNRVRHPDYPASICGVVYQGSERRTGCQFTFTCDGALARRPASASWARSRRHAQQAIAGRAFGDVGYATHYHTFEVWPYWGRTLTMTNMIGRHIFHRLRGRGGSPRYFTERYTGREAGPRPWRPRPAATASNADSDLVEVVAAAARAEDARQQSAEPNNLPPAPVARVEASRPVAATQPRRSDAQPDSRVMRDVLPESTIRPEHQSSGQWITN